MGLWVARMVMSSMYFCEEIPFEHVIIHPTVLGSDGKPMSKSRGNGVDPLRLMQDYGADGMRFGLLMQVTGTQDIKLESSRNFANKIRNAARFVLMNLDDYSPGDPDPANPADKWIFSRLAHLVEKLDTAFDSFEFGEITRELYSFFWNEFCDWYIEISKNMLQGSPLERTRCQRNLVFVLGTALRLLHPIMPFITEEIYQDLPGEKEAPDLILADWPVASEFMKYRDSNAERAMVMVTETISAVRAVRSRYKISPKQSLSIVVKAENPQDCTLLKEQAHLLESMAHAEELLIEQAPGKPKEAAVTLVAGLEVYVSLSGIVDFEAERSRLEGESKKLSADIEKLASKLANPGFLSKAAPEIIEKDRIRHQTLEATLKKVVVQLEELS